LVAVATATPASASTPLTAVPASGEAKAELAGEVLELLVKPGDRVQAGQALVRIDPADARLADSAARVQIEAAKAQLAAAEADFRRYTELRDQSFISAAEWDRRRAALALVRADFEATLDRLGLYTLRAARAGTVRSVLVKPGQSVPAGFLVLRLQVEATGAVSASAGPPGLVLPTGAVVDGRWVFRVREANGVLRVERVAVVLADADATEVLVTQGLAVGDLVVAAGAQRLADGDAVRVRR
jgi:multidrug efflux pump subunit AcrA (membrane-fusion protein)